MDKDSLYKQRVSKLLQQPNTVRGRTIMWYAAKDKKPCQRIAIIAFITLVVLLHTVWFTFVFEKFDSGVSFRAFRINEMFRATLDHSTWFVYQFCCYWPTASSCRP